MQNGASLEVSLRLNCVYGQYDSRVCTNQEYVSSNWVNASKNVLDFDAHGHLILNEWYDWNSSWDLQSADRFLYTYDSLGRTEAYIYQTSYLVPGQFENANKVVYSNFFVGAESMLKPITELKTFPNPVTDQLNFDLKLEKNGPVSIALFDIQGRKRLETMSNYNGNVITIPVGASLENGVYFYQLKMGEAIAKGKIVVAH